MTHIRVVLASLAVACCAAFLLFVRLGEVRAPIWDEAYYLTATARYHEGRQQFASHPPLGLMLIAAGDRIAGGNAGFDWSILAAQKSVKAEQVGEGFDYSGPRLAAAMFGMLAAIVFYLLMYSLAGNWGHALLLSPLFFTDTAFLAQLRAAQLDAFQIFFALLALLCAVRAMKGSNRLAWSAVFAFSVTAAALVRINGVLLGALAIAPFWHPVAARQWGQVAHMAMIGAATTLFATFAVFWLALAVAPLPPDSATPAGRIDVAHVTADYHASGPVLGTIEYASDYGGYIANDLEGMARSDPNASHPWQWPIGSGAMTYRWDAGETQVAIIAPIPNHAAWLVSLAGVIWAFVSLRKRREPLIVALLVCWAVNMAALAWLDGHRVMYIYHYFIPLLLGYALAALAWRTYRFDQRLALPVLVGMTLCTILALPLALHQSVPRWWCEVYLSDCGK